MNVQRLKVWGLPSLLHPFARVPAGHFVPPGRSGPAVTAPLPRVATSLSDVAPPADGHDFRLDTRTMLIDAMNEEDRKTYRRWGRIQFATLVASLAALTLAGYLIAQA